MHPELDGAPFRAHGVKFRDAESRALRETFRRSLPLDSAK